MQTFNQRHSNDLNTCCLEQQNYQISNHVSRWFDTGDLTELSLIRFYVMFVLKRVHDALVHS